MYILIGRNINIKLIDEKLYLQKITQLTVNYRLARSSDLIVSVYTA